MSPFTNDEIDNFKEAIKRDRSGYIDGSTILRIFERLEAAERYCETQAYADRMAWRVSKGELTGKIRLMNERKASGEGVGRS